jgi:tripartite-type tricarboxylate transporter receptor subunit TctC
MTIGAKLASIAKPDGYTLHAGSHASMLTAPMLVKDVGYNIDSFRLLFQDGLRYTFFLVRADSRWKTLDEFLSEAKQNPGKLKYASYGYGGIAHFATEWLCKEAGAKLTFLPFKTTAESITNVIGGHIDMAVVAGVSGMLTQLRALAVMADERLYYYPNIPTLKELGYPGFVCPSRECIVGPRGISDEVKNKWINVHRKMMSKYGKEVRERMPLLDLDPVFLDAESALKAYKESEKVFKAMLPLLSAKSN